MGLILEKLKNDVMDNVNSSDEIIVISGYATPSLIEEIAESGKKIVFIYGMYMRDGISKLMHERMSFLESQYANLDLRIMHSYPVHSKCYIFKNNGQVVNILVGSANCSINGLESPKNVEMLITVDDRVTIQKIEQYSETLLTDSVKCNDPIIMPLKEKKVIRKKFVELKPTSTNAYSAAMPLYYLKKGKKTTYEGGGLNWGLQKGHSKKAESTTYVEAYIPIVSYHIDNFQFMFPPNQLTRKSTDGKITRKNDAFDVIWDDGTLMRMIFSGEGVIREGREYPKQLTSDDGGGTILGEYIRRMGIGPRDKIKYSDLKKYGRDYIELRYRHPGYYEADFSV